MATMSLANTRTDFGAVARTLHWMTALLILTALPLGLVAERWPMATEAELAAKVTLFSLHKTLGVVAFLIALARILWALVQPRPVPLHPERRAETFLADTVHWALYLSMLLAPLTGWVHHAATTGFAPIWWPFGQRLPFVPVDEGLAHLAGGLHGVFVYVLLGAILLHVAGALKHHLVDRDDTLRRMLPGRRATPARTAAPVRHGLVPAVAALALYGLATAGALALMRDTAPASVLGPVETGWQVEEGTLAITIRQMGAEVAGRFETWTAAIAFDETPEAGSHGRVEVDIAIESLRLGSVTAQAMGADFFDAANHPTARFEAEILPEGEAYLARGTLTLRGVTLPMDLPFTLQIDGDRAVMEATATLDRLAFGIGASQPGEGTLGHGVTVDVALTARRLR
ncbi:cytochrome b/b6 domain-containing protein [Plastorhodobacter daqingensis]|uniref:Cytochrome b/b6 domain-containing protein n=1 Tax=Plastorhodobacter daqingensis TaxID=1387281 RepID=A0ABW2UJZ5_9RHOB